MINNHQLCGRGKWLSPKMSLVTASPQKVASEDELGQKWDRCIADAILKTGAGMSIGIVFSLLLFKRRPWPIALGSGFGLGYAASNCQHDFKRVESVYLKPVKILAQPSPVEGTAEKSLSQSESKS